MALWDSDSKVFDWIVDTDRTMRAASRELVAQVGDIAHDLPTFLTSPLFRRWHRHWGATRDEITATLPGDALLPHAQFRSTRAITIDAPPDAVWPWLVQVGCLRGGFYSNDLLDNLGHASAVTIRADLQHLDVGQWIPMSPTPTPSERNAFKVHSFDANRWLLWTKPDGTWSWRLTPSDNDRTRLVTRIHAVYDWRHPVSAFLGMLLLEFGDFAMQRRMLRGIKTRAENFSVPASPRHVGPPTTAATPASRIPTLPGVYLYWIPLGAGAQVVRLSGRTFEALSALVQRRARRDLYHSALVAVTTHAPFMIEMTPVVGSRGRQDRGVVAEGTVGTRWARRFRVCRYEIRRWRHGVIPDLSYAVASPVRVGDGEARARAVFDLVPLVPTPVWGRDELHAGEMWNSNSVTAWLLSRSGIDIEAIRPPGNGRAPGWDAGLAVAGRVESEPTPSRLTEKVGA
ncbi:MAG: hypothetical protein QOC92_1129 [Acidimicrobiaceae bacterium]